MIGANELKFLALDELEFERNSSAGTANEKRDRLALFIFS